MSPDDSDWTSEHSLEVVDITDPDAPRSVYPRPLNPIELETTRRVEITSGDDGPLREPWAPGPSHEVPTSGKVATVEDDPELYEGDKPTKPTPDGSQKDSEADSSRSELDLSPSARSRARSQSSDGLPRHDSGGRRRSVEADSPSSSKSRRRHSRSVSPPEDRARDKLTSIANRGVRSPSSDGQPGIERVRIRERERVREREVPYEYERPRPVRYVERRSSDRYDEDSDGDIRFRRRRSPPPPPRRVDRGYYSDEEDVEVRVLRRPSPPPPRYVGRSYYSDDDQDVDIRTRHHIPPSRPRRLGRDYYSDDSEDVDIRTRRHLPPPPPKHVGRGYYSDDDDDDEDVDIHVRHSGATGPRRSRYYSPPGPVRYVSEGRRPTRRTASNRRSGQRRLGRYYQHENRNSYGPGIGQPYFSNRHASPVPAPARAVPLSVTVPLDSKDDGKDEGGFNRPMADAWALPHTSLGKGVDTELLVINVAETYTDERGRSTATLYCPMGPLAGASAPASKNNAVKGPNKLHWLHIRYTSDIIKTLRDVVVHCPFVGNNIKSLALRHINRTNTEDIIPRNGEPSMRSMEDEELEVLRCDGEYKDDPLAADSVTFITTPYMLLHEKQRRKAQGMRSLLSFHYGYNVSEHRDNEQALRQNPRGFGKDIVNVAQLRCLLLGPGVIITCGEIPFSAILGDNITIDKTELRPPVTVIVTDLRGREHFVVVKSDVSFVELVARIQKMTLMEDFDIYEDPPGDEAISSNFWVGLLSGTDSWSEMHDLRLVLRRKQRTRRVEHEDFPRASYSRDVAYPSRIEIPPPTLHRPSRETKRIQQRDSHQRDSHVYGPRGIGAKDRRHHDGNNDSLARLSRSRTINLDRRSHLSRTRSSRLDERENEGAIMLHREPQPYSMQRRGPDLVDTSRALIHPVVSRREPQSDIRPHRVSRTRSFSQFRTDPRIGSKSTETTKILNEKNLRDRVASTYRLDSPDSDKRDHEYKQHRSSMDYYSGSGSDSDSSFGRPSSLKHVKFNDKKEGDQASTPPDDSTQTMTHVNIKYPFLTWRITQSNLQAKLREGSMTTLVRLLGKIDNNLSKDGRSGKLYEGGYECSREDIWIRHESVKKQSPLDVPKPRDETPEVATSQGEPTKRHQDAQTPDKQQPNSSTAAEQAVGSEKTTISGEDDAENNDKTNADTIVSHQPDGERPGPTLEETRLLVNVVEQADELTKDVFEASETIMALFVPLEGEIMDDAKRVLDRYWGALDTIFRHLQYAIFIDSADGEQRWAVRDIAHQHILPSQQQMTQTPWQGGCDACQANTEYSFAEALDHLHSAHFQHLDHESYKDRPYDDPCATWLRGTKIVQRGERVRALLDELESFKRDLKTLVSRAVDMHLFVTRPTSSSVVSEGNSEDKESKKGLEKEEEVDSQLQLQHRKCDHADTPALPASLLEAFKNILTMHIIHARVVLLTTRQAEEEATGTVSRERVRALSNKVFEGKRRYNYTFTRVERLFRNAHEDLILSITAEGGSLITLGAVGAEYLVAMALTNVQGGALQVQNDNVKRQWKRELAINDADNSETKRKLTWGKETQTDDEKGEAQPPIHSTKATLPLMVDLLEIYSAHMTNLEFSGSQRPKRRVFLAIRALEEELGALRRLAKLQAQTLLDYASVVRPDSFRITDTTRLALASLETDLLHHSMEARGRAGQELDHLERRAELLRLQVKETIEILEEGHGKAIRVFTLVTLFFLPLSFISGFFGMNTADIRDMPNKQWLYWSIAVPVTLVVLGSAYVYAYMGEGISGHLYSKWQSRTSHQGFSNALGSKESRALGRQEATVTWRASTEHTRRRRVTSYSSRDPSRNNTWATLN